MLSTRTFHQSEIVISSLIFNGHFVSIILEIWIVLYHTFLKPSIVLRFRTWPKYFIPLLFIKQSVYCTERSLASPHSIGKLYLFLFNGSSPVWHNFVETALIFRLRMSWWFFGSIHNRIFSSSLN